MATRKKKRTKTKRGKAKRKAVKKRVAKRKPVKKRAAKRKSAKKRPKKRPSKKAAASTGGPFPVGTGSGPSPFEIAQDFMALIRDGRSAECEEKWLAPNIESVEGVGASMAWRGKKAVLAKYRGWEADHEVHEMRIEGPWVGATSFAIRFWIDVSQKSTGQRMQMEEIAVYNVRNGKVAREEFHFAAPGG